MNNEKFYTFVKQIAKDNELLAESVITAHKLIFEGEEALEEGRLGRALAGTALATSLLTSPLLAKDLTVDEVRQLAKDHITAIAEEYVEESASPGFDPAEDLKSYRKAMKDYQKLVKQDQKLADLFARSIDQVLRNKFGLAGIGEMAKTAEK